MKETAIRNASALLDNSNEIKDYEVIKDEASFLLDSLTKQHKVIKELDALIDDKQRKIIKEKCDFYDSTLDERKYSDIKEFLEVLISKCNETLNVEKVLVYAARDLDEEAKNSIMEAISNKLNKKVELEIKIDKTLLGGYKICFDNKVYDMTIKNQMESLKSDLLSESR